MSETRRTHTFETSQHLAELFGQNDCHLAQIEQALDVHLSPRGTVVAMEGEDESVNVAELVLEALHVRLATGQEVTPGDVDGALRLALGGVSLGEHEMDRHMRRGKSITSRPCVTANWCSGWARRGRGRHTLPPPWVSP
jgi:phosphate starvation-inducible PhoH-like protein